MRGERAPLLYTLERYSNLKMVEKDSLFILLI